MLGCNLIILWFLQLWVWLPTFLSLDQVRWKWTSFYCVCWLIKYEVKTFLFYIRIFKLSDITTLSLHELFSIISLFFLLWPWNMSLTALLRKVMGHRGLICTFFLLSIQQQAWEWLLACWCGELFCILFHTMPLTIQKICRFVFWFDIINILKCFYCWSM